MAEIVILAVYPDGRLGEIFLNADRANSLLDFLMSDAAILASLALQHGCPLDEIRHALKRDAHLGWYEAFADLECERRSSAGRLRHRHLW